MNLEVLNKDEGQTRTASEAAKGDTSLPHNPDVSAFRDALQSIGDAIQKKLPKVLGDALTKLESILNKKPTVEIDINREQIQRLASVAHTAWQTYCVPKPRWLPIRDENGAAVTDIKTYLETNEIPERLWGNFRWSTGQKSFVERIDRLPLKYLSHSMGESNNLFANGVLGAALRLKEANDRDVRQIIEEAIQLEHNAFISKLSPIENRPRDRDWNDLDPRDKYTTVMMWKKVIACVDGLNERAVRGAFDGILRDINRELTDWSVKGNPSAVSIFGQIVRARGSMPYGLLRQNPELYSSLREKVPLVSDWNRPKELRDLDDRDLYRLYSSAFAETASRPKLDQLKFVEPPVPPGSGARVIIIKSKSEDKSIAVLKLGKGADFLQDFLSEMSQGSDGLRLADKTFRLVPSHLGRIGNGDVFFTVSPAAIGPSAGESYFKATLEAIPDFARNIGFFLSDVHRKAMELVRFSNDRQRLGDLSQFTHNQGWDIDQLADRVSTLEEKQLIAEPLAKKLKDLAERYDNHSCFEPTRLRPTQIHGDKHPDNIFGIVNALTEGVDPISIDNGSASYFVGRMSGTGDPASDVGRCVGYLIVEGVRRGFDWNTISSHIDPLMVGYRQSLTNTESDTESNQEYLTNTLPMAVAFHVSVYIARNALDGIEDGNPVKFKPLSEEQSLTDLKKCLVSCWSEYLNGVSIPPAISIHDSLYLSELWEKKEKAA
jgi:hypothetical protein